MDAFKIVCFTAYLGTGIETTPERKNNGREFSQWETKAAVVSPQQDVVSEQNLKIPIQTSLLEWLHMQQRYTVRQFTVICEICVFEISRRKKSQVFK
ncbi:hypothetical protein CEXT_168081 [Caerostris extrusa]|uniref:Uncharacterized protein n=1 Tax=Caerostris extrusa TaxID=172846 RepID=A0AAV4N2N8_CAEEX|nr:hypothetical protein CEXT_168081 [Caerostris extrusa]